MAAENVEVYPRLKNAKEIRSKIRIAIIGATGVGKSTLCNLLCNQKNAFKTNSGFAACTTQTQSVKFDYDIDDIDEKLTFEVIDFPGYINKKIPNDMDELKQFRKNIENGWQQAMINGISAFFLLIPYQRFQTKTVESLRFVQNYFDRNAFNHMTIIFTKSNKKSYDEIMNDIKSDEETQKLIQSLYNAVDDRCISSECIEINKNGKEKLRNSILKSAYYIHATNGICRDNVMVEAVDKLAKEIENKSVYQYSHPIWLFWNKYKKFVNVIIFLFFVFYVIKIAGTQRRNQIILKSMGSAIEHLREELLRLNKKLTPMRSLLSSQQKQIESLNKKSADLQEQLLRHQDENDLKQEHLPYLSSKL